MKSISHFLLSAFRFLLLLGALSAHAETRTATIEFTNRTWGLSNSITISGTTRYFTNDVSSSASTLILTNSALGSATNYFNHVSAYPLGSGIFATFPSSNKVVLYGDGTLTAAIGGSNWAVLTLTTNSTTPLTSIVYPVASLSATNRTNQARGIIESFAYAPSPVPTNSPGFTNYIDVSPRPQTLTGDVVTNAHVTGSTVSNSLFTNITIINVNIFVATNSTLLGGSASNFVLTNIAWINGYLGGLTNGVLIGTFVSNSPSVLASNLVATSKFTATNAIIDGLTATNFSAPGSGTSSQKIGSGSVASGSSSLAFGVSAEATNANSIAIGTSASSRSSSAIVIGSGAYSDTTGTESISIGVEAAATGPGSVAIGGAAVTLATHTNSVALGNLSLSTAANQIMLGTSSEHVSIPGRLESTYANLAAIVGTNRVAGSIRYTAGTVTSLVNGNNAGIILPTNTVVELSGATTIAQIAGFAASQDGDTRLLRFTGAVTNWIVNEANSSFSTDGTAANRIVTGTGGDITQTNQPAWVKLRYRGTSSRWEVLDHSR